MCFVGTGRAMWIAIAVWYILIGIIFIALNYKYKFGMRFYDYRDSWRRSIGAASKGQENISTMWMTISSSIQKHIIG